MKPSRRVICLTVKPAVHHRLDAKASEKGLLNVQDVVRLACAEWLEAHP